MNITLFSVVRTPVGKPGVTFDLCSRLIKKLSSRILYEITHLFVETDFPD